MTDPIITEDEKEALLEGMSSGAIEVQSSGGPSYASVTDFVIAPRCRIQTNSFPRLQSLNRQFAARMSKQVEVFLNTESDVDFVHVARLLYSEVAESESELSLIIEFSAEPLQGSAFLHLNASAVEMLVETFYGGDGNETRQQAADFFTPGEVNVATLFCKSVLATIADVWQPLEVLTLTVKGAHLSSGVIDTIDAADEVVSSNFSVQIGDTRQEFILTWPVRTVAQFLPVLEGQKRERDLAEDARWAKSIRKHLVPASVEIASGVGRTTMTLRAVAELSAGDVIPISNPEQTIVTSNRIAILKGRFGIHDGRYAIETTGWLRSPPTHEEL